MKSNQRGVSVDSSIRDSFFEMGAEQHKRLFIRNV